MLEELSKYENLGTPQYFFELLNLLFDKPDGIWNESEIQRLFLNRIIDGRIVFDGCVSLAIHIGLLEKNMDSGLIVPNPLNDLHKNKELLANKLAKLIIDSLKNDEDILNIFAPENLSFDLLAQSIKVTNKAFGFKYSNFKQLLIDFSILEPQTINESTHYLVSREYLNVFRSELLSEIKKKQLSPEQLKAIQEAQRIKGEEAERFVLDFELRRLNGKSGIVWVADYSVSDGYDIASFETEESSLNDRFIEVKSFSGVPRFFWSRNEIETSKLKGKKYYLYLINRDEMFIDGYEPKFINNPYENILKSEAWNKQVEKYYINFIGENLDVKLEQ